MWKHTGSPQSHCLSSILYFRTHLSSKLCRNRFTCTWLPRTQPPQGRKQQGTVQPLQALEEWDFNQLKTLPCNSSGKSYRISHIEVPCYLLELQAENPFHFSLLAGRCWVLSVNLFAKDASKWDLLKAMSPDHSWRNADLFCPSTKQNGTDLKDIRLAVDVPTPSLCSFLSLRMRVALVARDKSWLLQNRTP